MIFVKNLVKKYGSQMVVKGISFMVREKQIFGLLGPNGAGKTTTMEMMEGLRTPDGGSIEIAGIDAVKNRSELKRIIGVQLQSTSLFEHLTVRESLQLYGSFYRKTRPLKEILQAFDLTEKEKARVKHLSGGQRQRLAIAIAVIHDPRVIFLDEPTTGLDPQARRRLWDIVFQLRDEGRTVILSTHYMEEAEVLCDQVGIMSQGKIIDIDSPAGLIRGLSSKSRIEFVLPDHRLDQELTRLKGVTDVVREENEVVSLHTDHLSRTLHDLVPWASDRSVPLMGLRTRSATLEDVFLQKTGKRLSGE
ncbi:ABC transporter ATP-binding protein [Thermoactinomyces mirandus]|uniref:ABC transporter ATP-binding protein n=1 Tax=Thermoactinomyces mirandus TaxID=2756294 RepID=A0A7W1XU64_9BACL|nr:ABC transporter ATP-binding protein [Thermoactinomyces mirandus]MBA4603348.1 ABC transporter ATP-binding protein [Thermoactinomyces mirandus]